jgi:hypothetical protein
MKSILISVLALGAMTSVALAEEPLKPIAGQPMELSLAQLDDVTAGGKKKGHRFKNVNVSIIKLEVENTNTVKDCHKCSATINSTVTVTVNQS